MNNPLGQHGEFRDRFWLQGSLRYDKGTSQPSLEIVVLTGETLVGFTEKYNATPSKWVLKRWIKKSCEWPNYNIGRKKKKKTWKGTSWRPRGRKRSLRQNIKAQSIK